MKVDPDVTLIQNECAFLVAKATELFIESLAREAFVHTAQAKKKTVQKRDVDMAIANVDALVFLEGAMNFWMLIADPIPKILFNVIFIYASCTANK